MDYSKFIVSNQKEESISIQRVNFFTKMSFARCAKYTRLKTSETRYDYNLLIVKSSKQIHNNTHKSPCGLSFHFNSYKPSVFL